MKLLAGVVLLHASEQAFAHAHLVQFPNHDEAGQVLFPASLVLLTLGAILFVWGLVTEARGKTEIVQRVSSSSSGH